VDGGGDVGPGAGVVGDGGPAVTNSPKTSGLDPTVTVATTVRLDVSITDTVPGATPVLAT
jgi:hypothetical protein